MNSAEEEFARREEEYYDKQRRAQAELHRKMSEAAAKAAPAVNALGAAFLDLGKAVGEIKFARLTPAEVVWGDDEPIMPTNNSFTMEFDVKLPKKAEYDIVHASRPLYQGDLVTLKANHKTYRIAVVIEPDDEDEPIMYMIESSKLTMYQALGFDSDPDETEEEQYTEDCFL